MRTLVRRGRFFDGLGSPSAIRDVLVEDGHVRRISAEPLEVHDVDRVIELVPLLASLARNGCTVVTTIHQPSSEVFALFQQVLVLSRGHIIEDGTHAELLKLGGAYASLLKMGDDVSEEQAASVVDMVEVGGEVALADA